MSETITEDLLENGLVYRTLNGSIHQCDDSQRFLLRYGNESLSFRACEFIAFKRKIQQIELSELLEQDYDVEVLYMPHCDRFMVLTIFEILELRELMAGAFTMLELNSIIHSKLVRQTV